MKIINKPNVLINKRNYHKRYVQQELKNDYNLDFLFIIHLSKINFRIKEYYDDVDYMQLDNYGDLDNSNFKRDDPMSDVIEEYSCFRNLSYKVIDLSVNKVIYSDHGSAYYDFEKKPGNKMFSLNRTIMAALKETELVNK